MDNYDDEKFMGNAEADKFEMMDRRRETEFYLPPSHLKFTPEVKAKFATAGFALKWIRFRNGAGGLDSKNIRKRLHPSEGYTFVTPSEFNADELMAIGDIEAYNGSEIITNGDLVLMKVRVEKNKARKDYYSGKTKEQSEAIQRRLRENELDNKGSRSVVRTGKNAHFGS